MGSTTTSRTCTSQRECLEDTSIFPLHISNGELVVDVFPGSLDDPGSKKFFPQQIFGAFEDETLGELAFVDSYVFDTLFIAAGNQGDRRRRRVSARDAVTPLKTMIPFLACGREENTLINWSRQRDWRAFCRRCMTILSAESSLRRGSDALRGRRAVAILIHFR